VLKLDGTGNVTHWQRYLHGHRRYIKRESNDDHFAHVILTLKEFSSQSVSAGKYCYAFSMSLPKDIPATSHMINSQIKGLKGKIEYSL